MKIVFAQINILLVTKEKNGANLQSVAETKPSKTPAFRGWGEGTADSRERQDFTFWQKVVFLIHLAGTLMIIMG